MKRWAGILLAAALAIACCACSMQKPELSVAPSSFSRETTEVLRPFQSELQFVDLKLNEEAQTVEDFPLELSRRRVERTG